MLIWGFSVNTVFWNHHLCFFNVQIRAYSFLLSPREYPIGPVARKTKKIRRVWNFQPAFVLQRGGTCKILPNWFSRVSLKQLAVRERPGDGVWGWLLDLNWSEHSQCNHRFLESAFFCNNFAKSNLEKKIHTSIQSNIPFSPNPFPENFCKILNPSGRLAPKKRFENRC